MTAFHLAPHVTLQYWRSVPRLVAVNRRYEADFAIISVAVDASRSADKRLTVRFDLPKDEDALGATVEAINAAYTLGHFDRQNRTRTAMGCAFTDADAHLPLPQVRRSHDDRA